MNPLNLGGGGGGFNFGLSSGGLSTNPGSQLSTSLSTTTPATGSGGLSNPLSTGSSLFPTLGSGLGGSSLPGSTATATPAASTTTTSAASNPTTSTSAQPTQQTQLANPTLTFKVLEDYINKWTNELDSQEKDFLNQATQLNALDKLMIENGDKIVDLNSEVDRLGNEQDQLEQDLNFIFSQQNDLEQSIKKLETGIEQMPMLPQQHSDTSRIEMYKLLIEVDNQLKSTSGDLREVIKRLNDTNVNLNDPVFQIGKILNAHMDSLNWIEENSSLIQSQVDKLSKSLDERFRDMDTSASKLSFLS